MKKRYPEKRFKKESTYLSKTDLDIIRENGNCNFEKIASKMTESSEAVDVYPI